MRQALNALLTGLAVLHAGLATLGTWWTRLHLWLAQWWKGLRR